MESRKMNEEPNKDGFEGVLGFIRKNVRYFSAGVLFIILVLVLVKFAGPGRGTPVENDQQTEAADAQQEETEVPYQVDAYPAVNALVTQYYNAYATGDLGAVSCLAMPLSENEQSYITLFSQYVEGYQNIKCYTKKGLDDNSYLVSVALEIKFAGVDTVAPGLDFFYIRTNGEGGLYIDNLYSQYNLKNQENALDTSVQSLIQKFENEQDVIALQKEVQERYNTAVAADANLSTMITATIPNALKELETVAAQNPPAGTEAPPEQPAGTEAPSEAPAGTEAPAQEGQPEAPAQPADTEQPQTPPEQAPTGETLVALERVNVRASADTSAEKLGNIEMGEKVTRTGTEGDWSIIDFNGGKGYVKSEYLGAEGSQTAGGGGESGGGGSLSEGTVITLKDSVNVRASMSETAEKVGTAFSGEKVTVVMSYAEGWTKVNWNGTIGYIKTSLLQ